MTNEEAIKNITAYVYLEWKNMPSDVIKALDIMRECTEKQIPKKAVIKEGEFFTVARCPVCDNNVRFHAPYCDDCGNAIDWSEEE